jgi:hypothetical protein
MASVSNDPGGFRRILFTNKADERKSIRLGKVSQRAAESVLVHVENLVEASILNRAVAVETARWIAELGPVMLKKLARAGLIAAPMPKESVSLGAFLADYVESRPDVKESTRTVLGHTRRCLVEYFLGFRKLESITPTDAEAWRGWLASDQKLAPNTVRRRTGIARQFFHAARKRGYIDENPFTGLSAAVGANPSRYRFVSLEEIETVIGKAPDCQWRVLIALARYGGCIERSVSAVGRYHQAQPDDSPLQQTAITSRESRSGPCFPN